MQECETDKTPVVLVLVTRWMGWPAAMSGGPPVDLERGGEKGTGGQESRFWTLGCHPMAKSP